MGKKTFRHINKAEEMFKDAMFIYFPDFIKHETVQETYNYKKTIWSVEKER